MLLTSSLIAAALQVGPNPTLPYDLNPHDQLRDRPAREAEIDPSNPTSQWLAECLTLLETDPARAHTKAQIRLTEEVEQDISANYVVANHCLGLASVELELWQDAWAAFQAAKNGSPPADKRARARFGTMAGNAALADSNYEHALWLLNYAVEDARAAQSATLEALAAIDKARALVALERPEEGLTALESATQLEPKFGEGWLLKATLLRRLDRLAEAQTAIEEAVALAPLDSEIGLEAGVIAVLSGREDAARQSWQSVIDTQPDSLAAEKAKGYLEQIGPAQASAEPGLVQGPNP
ncbi:MAG: hypothetical protein AAGL10_06660 [Pseudomonadota bacterium]